jgi:hypothetical protein
MMGNSESASRMFHVEPVCLHFCRGVADPAGQGADCRSRQKKRRRSERLERGVVTGYWPVGV